MDAAAPPRVANSRRQSAHFAQRSRGIHRPAGTAGGGVRTEAKKTGFRLHFSDLYLVYQTKGGSPQIAAQGNVFSYGGDWQIRKLKSYLYHLRHKNWKSTFWKVNTSRKEAYRVESGTFGQLGGTSKKLDITVDLAGDASIPTRFLLRFPAADFYYLPAQGYPKLKARIFTLALDGDWKVKQLKPNLYHLRQKVWKDFFWKINTSRREVYRVENGSFGRYGGTEVLLDVWVYPLSRK